MVPNPGLNPKSSCGQPSHNQAPVPIPPNFNPMNRKASGPKASDKRKQNPAHQEKVQGEGTCPAYTFSPQPPTAPTPTVATTSTQMPVTRSTATASIPITVHKLATGKFAEVPYPTARHQNKGHPSCSRF